jgi:thioredoxin 1
MLYTNLIHLETAADLSGIIRENARVLVVCGRMDPQSVPAYRIAEELEKAYGTVKFCDMEFDNPESLVVQKVVQAIGLMEIPYTAYYRNGEFVDATSGIQTKDQVIEMMHATFKIPINFRSRKININTRKLQIYGKQENRF